MKTIHAILALIFASLFIAAFSFAAEEIEKHHIQIKIDDGTELVDIAADDLEVGEARESYTDSGKKVLVTRTEQGYELEVDGKQIDLGMHHGDSDHSVFVHSNETSKVIVRRNDDQDVKYAFIHSGEDHGTHHWVQHGEEGEDFKFVIERKSASKHLLESGVLDELDEDTRQRILDTLNEMEPHKMIKKRIHVEVHEDTDEMD